MLVVSSACEDGAAATIAMHGRLTSDEVETVLVGAEAGALGHLEQYLAVQKCPEVASAVSRKSAFLKNEKESDPYWDRTSDLRVL